MQWSTHSAQMKLLRQTSELARPNANLPEPPQEARVFHLRWDRLGLVDPNSISVPVTDTNTIKDAIYQARLGSGGTAFSFHPDGYFLTAAHVVQNVERGELILENTAGKSILTQVISTNECHDLALLKAIEPESAPYPYLRLATKSGSIDSPVVQYGFPARNGRRYTSEPGTITARNNTAYGEVFGYEFNLSHNAGLGGGSSGGPFLNESLEVVGIVQTGGNFDIRHSTGTPVEEIARQLTGMFATSFQNGLGFEFRTLPGGVVKTTYIYPDSPAARAGLQVGDLVKKIKSKGKVVFDSQGHRKLWKGEICRAQTASDVYLEILREGRSLTIKL